MAESCYVLLFMGIIVLIIGLWIWKKGREQMELMENRLMEKENALYELYQALEDIIQIISEDYQEKEQQRQINQCSDKQILHTKNDQVIELKNKGYSEEQIAKELKIGKGEVKIILGLKN